MNKKYVVFCKYIDGSPIILSNVTLNTIFNRLNKLLKAGEIMITAFYPYYCRKCKGPIKGNRTVCNKCITNAVKNTMSIKKFNKQKHIKALSRAGAGQPPTSKVITPKNKKPPKYKEKYDYRD